MFDDVNVVRPLPDCTIAPEPEIDSPKLRPSVWSKRIVPAWLTTNPAAMVGAGPPAAIESVPLSIVATDARLPATIDAEPPATVSPPPIEPFRSVKPPEPPTVRGAAMVTAVDPSPASTAPPDTATATAATATENRKPTSRLPPHEPPFRYEIELLSWREPNPTPDRHAMRVAQRVCVAAARKERGAELYAAGCWAEVRERYRDGSHTSKA